jgi:hypothetical protein
MKPSEPSSNSSSVVSFDGKQQQQAEAKIPDVADVPDLILESIHLIKKLQQDERDEIQAIGRELEKKLRRAMQSILNAVDQLEAVA